MPSYAITFSDEIVPAAGSSLFTKTYDIAAECFYIELDFGTYAGADSEFEITVRFE